MTDKKLFKEVMEQKKFEIQVRNLENGFMLEVNKEGYMYYDVISLIEGICIHVGLERFNAMTKKEIKTNEHTNRRRNYRLRRLRRMRRNG